MKYIIHLSPTSEKDEQSQIWLEQLKGQLTQPGNVVIEGKALPKETSLINAIDYSSVSIEEFHIVLLCGKKDIFWSKALKSLAIAPLTIWQGLSIYPEMLEPKTLLPDICIIPDWIVRKDNICRLERKTTLLRINNINYKKTNLDSIKNEIFQKYTTAKLEKFSQNIFAVQLEGASKSNCFSSAPTAEKFISNLACQISEKVEPQSKPMIFVAAPRNASKQDKINAQYFIKALDEKLNFSKFSVVNKLFNLIGYYSFNITEVEGINDQITAPETMLILLEKWPKATYLVPSSEKNLLCQTIDVSIKGTNIISYGTNQTELTHVMNMGGFLTSMSYDGLLKSNDYRDIMPVVEGETVNAILNNIHKKIILATARQAEKIQQRAKSAQTDECKESYKSILRQHSNDYDVSPPEIKYLKNMPRVANNRNIFFWSGLGVAAALVVAAVNVCRSKLPK